MVIYDWTGRPAEAEDEPLRFLASFHDVFLTLGLFILNLGLLIGVGSALEAIGEPLNNGGSVWIIPAMMFAVFAGLQWLMALYFTRHKKRLLPSILLCLSFIFAVMLAVLIAYIGLFAAGDRFDAIEEVDDLLRTLGSAGTIVIGLTALASLGFYLFFRLPFSMGTTMALVAWSLIVLVGAIMPDALMEAGGLVAFLAGVLIFAVGVGYDVRDPDRISRFSDNGFWLHLFAAPLMLNGALSLIATPNAYGDLSAAQASTILALLCGFAFLSVLINRRALVVSGLASAGVAIFSLVEGTGLDGAPLAALTLVLLGALVVWLGAGWHAVRSVVVAPFPRTGLIARIIPPVTVDG